MEDVKMKNSKILFKVLLIFAIFWTAMSIVYGLIYGTLGNILPGFLQIMRTPAQCTRDMFGIGVEATYFNMSMCAFLMLIIILITKAYVTSVVVASYFLTIAFTTWGMTPLNMLPPILGVALYSKIMKVKLGSIVQLCFFATGVSPIVSELMLRWPFYGGDGMPFLNPGQTNLVIQPLGVVLALVFGLLAGLAIPPLCEHTKNVHKGYNLFNAGLPAGMICWVVVGFIFKLTNIPEPVNGPANELDAFPFVFVCYAILFIICLFVSFMLDRNSFKNYKNILKDSGFNSDFVEKYGVATTLANFGFYGLFILMFYTLMKIFFGAEICGPVAGVVWSSFTFVAAGVHPRNVFPIAIGYVVASLFSSIVFPFFGLGLAEGRLSMNSVSLLVAFAYATGLAPIVGHYGYIIGIFVTIIQFAMVTLTPRAYYFFNFYNSGMTASLAAYVSIPIIEKYFIKFKKDNKK